MTATKEIVWREVFIQRPYEMETLYDILTHIASLTARGPIIWEARCKGGVMRYLLGTSKSSVTRVQEVFKAHSGAQFAKGVHTFDPKCEVMLTIMSSLAQEESRSISENVRWGKQKSMQDGKVYVAYSRFLGYCKGEDGRMEIVEDEAKIVREIYKLFLGGKTIRHIAEHLTEHGILTPSGKNKWSVSTVKSILSNEKYKGDALLQKTYTVDYLTKEVRKNDGTVRQYLVENSRDPIIEPEVFDKVQEKLRKQRIYRPKIRDDSIFSNKLICGDCGGFYGHKVWHNRNNTERYDVWYCNQKYSNTKKCQSPVIREAQIKEAFKFILKEQREAVSTFSEEKWRSMVESVTIYDDNRLIFHLSDGGESEAILTE